MLNKSTKRLIALAIIVSAIALGFFGFPRLFELFLELHGL